MKQAVEGVRRNRKRKLTKGRRSFVDTVIEAMRKRERQCSFSTKAAYEIRPISSRYLSTYFGHGLDIPCMKLILHFSVVRPCETHCLPDKGSNKGPPNLHASELVLSTN